MWIPSTQKPIGLIRGNFMAKLLLMVTLTLVPKSKVFELTPGLSHTEFKCKCKRPQCTHTLVSDRLLYAYYNTRLDFDEPLIINSGYRCQSHNMSNQVGGAVQSSHTTGHAIDISTTGLSIDDTNQLVDYARFYFDFVKVYDTFIHCQING